MSYAIGADFDAVDLAADVADRGPLIALGTIMQDYTGKTYKRIVYSVEGGLAGVAGEVTYYVTSQSAGAYDVTSDVSAGLGGGAGVLQAAMADNDHGWIQVGGQATLTIALDGGADGNALTPVGASDGSLDVSALVTDDICAVAMDVSAKIIWCKFPH